MRYGLIFPHFGQYASREQLINGAKQAEHHGFDSVWLRDHVSYITHPWEDQDLTFVDPLVAMSAMAGVTDRLMFGTAGLIPHRHPIHLAGLLASLDLVAGPGRIIAGMAVGAYDKEFNAVGMEGWDRRELIQEQVEICRRLWTGESVTHQGKFYQFESMHVHPVPAPGSIQVWYCGSSLAAVRRAVEYCDGWGLARMPRRDLTGRLQRLRKLAAEAQKPVPVVGVNAYVSPGRNKEEAERNVDFSNLLKDYATRQYTPPESGSFQTLEDLDGVVLAGPADAIVEGVQKTKALGPEIQHFVFDLRQRFADWDECVSFLGEEVLPLLRRADAVAEVELAATSLT